MVEKSNQPAPEQISTKYSRREAILLALAGSLGLALACFYSLKDQKSSKAEPVIIPRLFLPVVLKDDTTRNTPYIKGLCYGPYRDGQNPNWGPYPSESDIRTDISLLNNAARYIRTYGADHNQENIPRFISEQGVDIKINAGCWLGNDDGVNQQMINSLVQEANSSANVFSATVGNETQQSGAIPESKLISYIQNVRARVPASVSVTTGETWFTWYSRPQLVGAADYILAHFFPYWEQPNPIPIEGAVSFIRDKYNLLKSLYPNKKIVIGETGWPSAGAIRGGATPSLENQRRFINELSLWAENDKIDFYLFEAFDEVWKTQYEGEVGRHWGIFYSDRIPKHPGLTLLP